MTVSNKVLIPAKQAENVQTTQYLALNVTTIIDKFSVTNTNSVNVLFSVNIVTAFGVAGVDNRILGPRAIAPNETFTCPELVGQTLSPGDFISTLAGTATSLTIRASGREIT
jgi:hypothetical protein